MAPIITGFLRRQIPIQMQKMGTGDVRQGVMSKSGIHIGQIVPHINNPPRRILQMARQFIGFNQGSVFHGKSRKRERVTCSNS